MTKSVASPVFVDTNVFVYREDGTDPAKQARADAWLSFLFERRQGRVSFQVMHELYSVLTGKLKHFEIADARQIVRELAAWRPVTPDVRLLERSWLLQERFSFSWWDALIVAAAQASDCRFLLTEDLQHDQSFDGVRVINPFRSPDRTPSEVLEELP
ncbi:MAG: PIN domain-containing protein [Acidobacteria bacterium]|nr:PIN domain-containing protein [Acidobacteriota bacterium]MYA45709.1 PIN domain-containing protein [Acidobacteriota bacterium]MYI40209.1 PIN domain-containing protein [Acidobacteriota bacterium]